MTVASLLVKLGDADPASESLTMSGGELLQQPNAVAGTLVSANCDRHRSDG